MPKNVPRKKAIFAGGSKGCAPLGMIKVSPNESFIFTSFSSASVTDTYLANSTNSVNIAAKFDPESISPGSSSSIDINAALTSSAIMSRL